MMLKICLTGHSPLFMILQIYLTGHDPPVYDAWGISDRIWLLFVLLEMYVTGHGCMFALLVIHLRGPWHVFLYIKTVIGHHVWAPLCITFFFSLFCAFGCACLLPYKMIFLQCKKRGLDCNWIEVGLWFSVSQSLAIVEINSKMREICFYVTFSIFRQVDPSP